MKVKLTNKSTKHSIEAEVPAGMTPEAYIDQQKQILVGLGVNLDEFVLETV